MKDAFKCVVIIAQVPLAMIQIAIFYAVLQICSVFYNGLTIQCSYVLTSIILFLNVTNIHSLMKSFDINYRIALVSYSDMRISMT